MKTKREALSRTVMIAGGRGLVTVAVLAGAAVGLASPASAEPPNGSYTRTNNGNGIGGNFEVMLTPCGSGCTHYERPGYPPGHDLHLGGNSWVSDKDEYGGSMSFDKDSLQGTDILGGFQGGSAITIPFTLTKNG